MPQSTFAAFFAPDFMLIELAVIICTACRHCWWRCARADSSSILRALGAFVAFCLCSSAVDLVNDIVDRDADRRHPIKATRLVASAPSPRAAHGLRRACSPLAAVTSRIWYNT